MSAQRSPPYCRGQSGREGTEFFSGIDKDILELSSKFPCNREDVVREYLKSLFDRHQTLDRQRRGSALSRDDRVRLQYSPVRLAEVLVLNAIASTRGDNAVPNQ